MNAAELYILSLQDKNFTSVQRAFNNLKSKLQVGLVSICGWQKECPSIWHWRILY